MSLNELLAMAGRSIDDLGALDLGYRPTFGTRELRSAVASLYENVKSDDVLAFSGAQEALFWVLAELLRDGGHAVVAVPNYQSMETIPLASSASVSGLPLWEGSGPDLTWTLDLDRLESLLRPDTRVVAVNFPNNPTGFVPARDTFIALAELCHERGIILMSDEVYRGIDTDPDMTFPHAADLSPSAVSINVLSKSYGPRGFASAGSPPAIGNCWAAWRSASTTRASATPASPSTWPRSRSGSAIASTPAIAPSLRRTS